MKNFKNLLSVVALVCLFLSCSSDDDSGSGSNCPAIADQPAQGNFRGRSFTNEGGFFSPFFGEFRCRINVSAQTGGSCRFPTFGGDEGTILFSIPTTEPQTITFSETGENTLNFNTIEGVTTTAELATCGTVEIISSTATTLTGRIVANGQDGSSINGNFILDYCD